MLGPVVETVTSSSANPIGGSVSHRIASNDNNIAPVRAVLMVPRMPSGDCRYRLGRMLPQLGLVLLIYGAVANVRKLSDRFREEGIHHRRILARISDDADRILSFLQLFNFAHHDLSQHDDTAVRRR